MFIQIFLSVFCWLISQSEFFISLNVTFPTIFQSLKRKIVFKNFLVIRLKEVDFILKNKLSFAETWSSFLDILLHLFGKRFKFVEKRQFFNNLVISHSQSHRGKKRSWVYFICLNELLSTFWFCYWHYEFIALLELRRKSFQKHLHNIFAI